MHHGMYHRPLVQGPMRGTHCCPDYFRQLRRILRMLSIDTICPCNLHCNHIPIAFYIVRYIVTPLCRLMPAKVQRFTKNALWSGTLKHSEAESRPGSVWSAEIMQKTTARANSSPDDQRSVADLPRSRARDSKDSFRRFSSTILFDSSPR